MTTQKLPFSQRYGTASKKPIQHKGIDKDLRNRLYNCVFEYYLEPFANGSYPEPPLYKGFSRIWSQLFKKPLDERPEYFEEICDEIREYMQTARYDKVFDFLEFLPAHFEVNETVECIHTPFMVHCNDVFQSETAAYRFVDGLNAELSSENEIQQVEKALHSPLDTVKIHLKRAQELLADKRNPDNRNSIKESISAVESFCKAITGTNQTLGQTLGLLAKHGIEIPPSLQSVFEKLYGWSSSEDGIRHGLLEKSKLDQEDAIFALVACSSFINYLTAKASKAKIDLTGNRRKFTS